MWYYGTTAQLEMRPTRIPHLQELYPSREADSHSWQQIQALDFCNCPRAWLGDAQGRPLQGSSCVSCISGTRALGWDGALPIEAPTAVVPSASTTILVPSPDRNFLRFDQCALIGFYAALQGLKIIIYF